MKQKRKSPAFVKLLACLLVLASLAMLLLPWMKLAVDTGNGRLSVQEVLSLVGETEESIRIAAEQELASEGIQIPDGSLRQPLSLVLSGSYSLPALARICGGLGELLQACGQAGAGSAVTAAGYAVWGLIGLLALLGLIALCCVFTDHRGGILPYLLMGVLAAAGGLLLRAEANRLLEAEGTALVNQWGAGILISYFGADIHIVKMGIAAYLCPFLALLALLLMGIRKKTAAPARREPVTPYPARKTAVPAAAPEKTAAAPAGWTCPNCGSVRGVEEHFCSLCGTPRQRREERKTCPNCGRELPETVSFCPDCGARL